MVAVIEKLEAILVGHKVQLQVWDVENNAFPESLHWDPKKRAIMTPYGLDLKFEVAYPGKTPYNLYEIATRIQRLTNKALGEQEEYDAAAVAAAAEVALYLTDAPWFKEEIIDPVQAVMPRENT
jgi:hypothetical protein